MDTDHLRRLFDAGHSFREAFDAACHSDTVFAVEAFRLWSSWEHPGAEISQPFALGGATAVLAVTDLRHLKPAIMPYPIGTSDHAVCWLLRDEWAGLPPGVWCRDGRSSWLVPGTQTMENAR